MKAQYWILVIAFVLVAVVGLIDPFGFLQPDEEMQQLVVLRSELIEYTYKNGTAPKTLSVYLASNPRSVLRHSVLLKESPVLNGSGGWYYDPNKLLVGINKSSYSNSVLSFDPKGINK